MGHSKQSFSRALQLSKKHTATLHINFVMEEKIPSSLSALMNYSGFIGNRPRKDVTDLILKEYKSRAKDILNLIILSAKEAKIKTKSSIIHHGSLTKVSAYIKKNSIDYVVLNYTKEKFIHQRVLDSFIDDFIEKLDIPYELFFDGIKQKRSEKRAARYLKHVQKNVRKGRKDKTKKSAAIPSKPKKIKKKKS